MVNKASLAMRGMLTLDAERICCYC